MRQNPSTATAGAPPSDSWSSARASSARSSGSIASASRRRRWAISGTAGSAGKLGLKILKLGFDYKYPLYL